MYLLDTNVISEMRKAGAQHGRGTKIDPHVQSWVLSVEPASLYLSAITILELDIGRLLLERCDPMQGAVLRKWIRDRILPAFSSRILPVDVTVAQRCAALHVPDPMNDRDSLIAATALVHGMTLITRNVSRFERTGVDLLNPWAL